MRYNVSIRNLAEDEFLDAVAWYEMQRKGLGTELILCFEESLEILKRDPFYEIRYNDVRILNIRRFPYQIVYYIDGNTIEIIAFFHAHRDPENWRGRK